MVKGKQDFFKLSNQKFRLNSRFNSLQLGKTFLSPMKLANQNAGNRLVCVTHLFRSVETEYCTIRRSSTTVSNKIIMVVRPKDKCNRPNECQASMCKAFRFPLNSQLL